MWLSHKVTFIEVTPSEPGPSWPSLVGRAHAVEHVAGQELGRGVDALEHLEVVEILVAELGRRSPSASSPARPMSTTMLPSVEPLAAELAVDDEGGAVQLLRRAEHLALEAVRDHHVVADANAVHAVNSLLAGFRLG